MSPQFHLPDGSGYDFAVEMIPKVDALNPQAPQPSTDHEQLCPNAQQRVLAFSGCLGLGCSRTFARFQYGALIMELFGI